jgi:KAP family P-loop domain.
VERIKLTKIDTSVAAKNFLKKLQENKTYFLNGKWGSGKTEFLNSVKQESKKMGYKKKFINLDIWNTRDSRSLMEIAYSKLHPIMYMFSKYAVILCITVSVLATPNINLGIEGLLRWIIPNMLILHIVISFGIAIALFVTVWRILKIKSDTWYSKHISNCLSNKVLIIDDFDRAYAERQKEAYKLFNVLNEKHVIPIVFVGDFSKIIQNKGIFLQKIIDNRIELPYVLHPQNIWSDYFKQIEENFDTKLTYQFKQIFIQDGRNLRDRERFNNYVMEEFIDGSKYERVQVMQQLLVIYIYLFYPSEYQNLLDNVDVTIIFYDREDIAKLLEKNEKYPISFAENRDSYFLYETVVNLTTKEAEEILENLANNGYLYSDTKSDFYQYFDKSYNTFETEQKNELFKLALNCVKEFKITPIVKLILKEERRLTGGVGDLSFYKKWTSKLGESGVEVDDSEKIYILESILLFSFDRLSKVHEKVDLNDKKLKELKIPSYYILLYLVQKNTWGDFSSWNENIWRFVNSMNDQNYLVFWIMQGVLNHQFGYLSAMRISDDNQYTIITDPKSEKGNETKKKNRIMVLDKIQARIEKLREKGYIFNES